MTNGDLLCEFLDFDFLEGQELGGSGGREELTAGVVVLTFLGGTDNHWGEGFGFDFLEDFGTAAVAGVGVYKNSGLHIAHTGGDTPNGDKVTKVLSTDLADGEGFVTGAAGGKGLEENLVATGELGGEVLRLVVDRSGAFILMRLEGGVAVTALGQDYV
jgi:hypothetical protein